MDWSSSGIINTFEYEIVDVLDFHHIGWLDRVDSAKTTMGYYTDAKAELELQTAGGDPIGSRGIRVWHTATLGSESYRHVIGTYIPDYPANSVKELYGMADRGYRMKFPIDRLTTDIACKEYPAKKGRNVASWFRFYIEDAGCKVAFDANFDQSMTFNGDWIWPFGDTVLKALNTAAGMVGAQVGCDLMGNITVSKFIAPSKRSPVFRFDRGNSSILAPGMTRERDDIVNRVGVEAEKDGRKYYAEARVPDSSPLSFKNLGRYYTKVYTETIDASNMQQAVDNKAKQYLAEYAERITKWQVESLYVPLSIGDVVTIDYDDGGTRECFNAMVQNIEFDHDAKMMMKLTLTRNWGDIWTD